MLMKSNSTKARKVKITPEIREAYEKRDKSLDNADPENPVLPPEAWEKHGVIGKYYRPVKTPVSVRIDNDVLAWLKAKGPGYQSRINEILRREMVEGRKKAS
jgi:uncharacterized protein (DUF4415 family)